jgi:hypothetical protein
MLLVRLLSSNPRAPRVEVVFANEAAARRKPFRPRFHREKKTRSKPMPPTPFQPRYHSKKRIRSKPQSRMRVALAT